MLFLGKNGRSFGPKDGKLQKNGGIETTNDDREFHSKRMFVLSIRLDEPLCFHWLLLAKHIQQPGICSRTGEQFQNILFSR